MAVERDVEQRRDAFPLPAVHLRGDLLPGDGGVLALGRFQGGLGEGFGTADLAASEPGLEPAAAGARRAAGGW